MSPKPNLSGKKKEPKPKLFGPDIFRWGGGLPGEGVGAKKFGVSLEARETKFFWRDMPGEFAGISRKHPKSLRKNICVQYSFPNLEFLLGQECIMSPTPLFVLGNPKPWFLLGKCCESQTLGLAAGWEIRNVA